MFAFWKYDLYPYYIGGKVTEDFGDDGVEVAGYPGSIVRPTFFLPDEKGEKLVEELKDLKFRERVARDVLKEEWIEKLNMYLPESFIINTK